LTARRKTSLVGSSWIGQLSDDRRVASENHVALLNGSTLYVLRSTDGEMMWQKKTDGVPGASAAISNEYVFVPMVNGAIESYTLADPKAVPWIYRSLGRAMVQPALGFGSLAWPTDFGHLVRGVGDVAIDPSSIGNRADDRRDADVRGRRPADRRDHRWLRLLPATLPPIEQHPVEVFVG
jgi:hypothetical protein